MRQYNQKSIFDSTVFLKRKIVGIEGVCTYCGESSSDLDHMIPFHHLPRPYTPSRERHRWGLQTYSCSECNRLLGGALHESFPERLEYLRNQLRTKYQKLINTPRWSEEELEEYSEGIFRDYLIGSSYAIEKIYSREYWTRTSDFIKLCNEMAYQVEGHEAYQEWLYLDKYITKY